MTTISSSHAADKLVSSLSSSARCMYDGLSNYKYNSPTITWQVATVKISSVIINLENMIASLADKTMLPLTHLPSFF